MKRALVLVVAVVAGSLALVARPASGATQQFLWYDQQVTHTERAYAEPTQSAATPASWVSPVSYVNGRVYTRVQVLSKPSTKPVDMQICVWRNSFAEESCSLTYLRYSTPGVYYVDYGVPSQWWKKGGTFSWATRFSPTRFMIKDPNTGKLLMTASCGASCSTASAVTGHVPISLDVATVVVAQGATLAPPADWTGCPAAWSPSCSGGGATTTSTTSTSVTTSTTSTTSTTIPPSGAGPVKLVVSTPGSIPPGDVPIRNRLLALGRTVQLVDDDGVSASSLAGASLVVISSSVVPSKIPASLASLAIPILDAEAYVQTTLKLATSGSERAATTSLQIVSASHPLAAGLTGTPVVQASAPLAVGGPAPGATVIARVPGLTSASVYGIDTGAALTSGAAPARRVGFFFSYDSPTRLTASGWKLFDAAVTWLSGSSTTPPPPPSGWAVPEDGHRLPVTIGAATAPRVDHPVVVPVTFGLAVDPASLRVVEVDSAGATLDLDVPFQLDGSELVVLLEGMTSAGATRRYHVYYDGPGTGLAPASVAPRVTATDGIVDQGQTSVRVATAAGTWFLHKAGGGFSSLVDAAGADWLGYSTAAGSAGAYRGMPNAVHPAGHFHPGSTTAATQIVSAGPLRVRLVSTTTDGAWQLRYDVFPRFVTMTMTKSAAAYWFLYEGTPGGQIDPTTDVVIRSGGAQTPLSQSWTGDLAGEEWAAFADTVRDRALYVAHHQSDAGTDSHYLMEGNMTVFGFGRSGLNKYLTGVHTFTAGLVDADTNATIAPVVQGAMRPVSASVGAAQARPA